MKEAYGKRGGSRPGAGRKPSGRVQYVTRLKPDHIAWVKGEATNRGSAECEVVEEAIGEKIAKHKPRKPRSK